MLQIESMELFVITFKKDYFKELFFFLFFIVFLKPGSTKKKSRNNFKLKDIKIIFLWEGGENKIQKMELIL